QRAIFDKIGIRTMVMETDPFGNFLTQGYELMSGRDWARLGNLYLQGGVWNGDRILPEAFVKFVSTPAPAWVADERPVYGGRRWQALRGFDRAIRRVARVSETETRRRRSGLQRRRDGGAAARVAVLPATAGCDRSGGMAGCATGRLAHRSGGDERPRLRSSRAPAVGGEPGVLRHGLSRPKRSARARRAGRVRRPRALELQIPVERRRCPNGEQRFAN